MQNHRRLLVWQRSHGLAVKVRRTTRRFPRTGYGSLQSQMTRAAESILFNIVEGAGATSQKDFARFLDVAVKSSTELESQLELARDYGILSRADCRRLVGEATEIRRMLCGLRAKVLATVDPN